jgi:hypothetical protein
LKGFIIILSIPSNLGRLFISIFPISCVSGENPEPVTGLGAAAGRRQAHKEIR